MDSPVEWLTRTAWGCLEGKPKGNPTGCKVQIPCFDRLSSKPPIRGAVTGKHCTGTERGASVQRLALCVCVCVCVCARVLLKIGEPSAQTSVFFLLLFFVQRPQVPFDR